MYIHNYLVICPPLPSPLLGDGNLHHVQERLKEW